MMHYFKSILINPVNFMVCLTSVKHWLALNKVCRFSKERNLDNIVRAINLVLAFKHMICLKYIHQISICYLS